MKLVKKFHKCSFHFSMFQNVVIFHQRPPLRIQAGTGSVLGVGLVNLCFFSTLNASIFHPSMY